jgi:predicted RND superfamily exporter protein
MSAWLADFIFRFRYPLCAFILAGAVFYAPKMNITDIDNETTMWISTDDPVYQQYQGFVDEFGGQRVLLIALQSDRLFTPDSLEFIRRVTGDIERVELVERVQSLASANIVVSLPAREGDGGGIEVQPLLEDRLDDAAAARIRARALADPLLRGDLVSEDGTVTVLSISFDEDRIDDVRGEIIERIHGVVDDALPRGMRAYYNGGLEISETYNRITPSNSRAAAALLMPLCTSDELMNSSCARTL